MIFGQIASILRVKGREIFQQERVDKGHQENRQRDSLKHSGDCLLMDGTEDALTSSAMAEVYGRHELRSREPNNSEIAISCNPGAEPDLRRSESRGELSKEKSPFRFFDPMDALIESMRRGRIQLEDRIASRDIFRGVIDDGLQHLRPSPIDEPVGPEAADSGSFPGLLNGRGVDADLKHAQLLLNAFGQHSLVFRLKFRFQKCGEIPYFCIGL